MYTIDFCDNAAMSDQRTALVLGGGGITGIAWEIGLLAGLADAGVDLSSADLVVGTSAGSVVGAQLTSGADVEMLYARQLEPPTEEKVARMTRSMLAQFAWAMLRTRGDSAAFRRRIGSGCSSRSCNSSAPPAARPALAGGSPSSSGRSSGTVARFR